MKNFIVEGELVSNLDNLLKKIHCDWCADGEIGPWEIVQRQTRKLYCQSKSESSKAW